MLSIRILILAVGLLVSKVASAALLTWQITGTVANVGSPLAHIFSLGDDVRIVFTFDTLATDSNPGTSFGDYLSAMTSGEVTVGTYTASFEKQPLFVANDVGGAPADLFGFNGLDSGHVLSAPDLHGSDGRLYKFDGIYGHFADTSANMLSTDLLPTSADLLEARSNQRTMGVSWTTPLLPNVYLQNGVGLTDIHLKDITTVPEPGTLALIFLSLLVLGARRREQSQRATLRRELTAGPSFFERTTNGHHPGSAAVGEECDGPLPSGHWSQAPGLLRHKVRGLRPAWRGHEG